MIAVYVNPENLTLELYQHAHYALVAAGAPETGRIHHSCFGEPDHLMVYDIWDSQADFDAFAAHLGPIMEQLGIKMERPPDIIPIVAVDQSAYTSEPG
jgi:hypothetical protein